MFEQNTDHQQWLCRFLRDFDAAAGSVHEQRGENLYLTAAENLPLPVINAVKMVPRGKGMAGLAQVRRTPVQTCNLQTDQSGDVKPGAKAVNAQAAIAVPVFSDAGEVRAVVGAAWMNEGQIDSDREQALLKAAASLPLNQ